MNLHTALPVHTEVSTGIAYLAQLLGKSVRVFAYPNGIPTTDYLSEHARLVESLGLEGAVSTQRGVSTRSSAPYQLRRFTPS
jgi:hypothetical protein